MYIYENCGQEIHVYDAVHLKLKRSGVSLIPNTACDNTVIAHSKSQDFGAPAKVETTSNALCMAKLLIDLDSAPEKHNHG